MSANHRSGARIALASSRVLAEPPEDDVLLQAALEAAGSECHIAAWDDPGVGWRGFDAVVIRSTWNYFLRPDAFLGWLSALEALGVVVCNPAALVRWNAHKAYLIDLESRGVSIIPTEIIRRGSKPDWARVLSRASGERLVVKPAVSGNSFRTLLLEDPCNEAALIEASEAVEAGDVLVQPYMPEIAQGELSFIFIDGRFSHAVRKLPAAGDFRVQRQFGGREELVDVDRGLVRLAASALQAAGPGALLARVDGLVSVDGHFLLMELELIEPALFLGMHPGAAEQLAEAIVVRTLD